MDPYFLHWDVGYPCWQKVDYAAGTAPYLGLSAEASSEQLLGFVE